MPYISALDRTALDLYDLAPTSAGELNYKVTRLVDDYLAGQVSYERINEVIGVLECAKLELYRRIAAPYEDAKMAENGDVYDSRA